MSKLNLYIDCTNGISGDMLCQCLTNLCDNPTFVEAQQQLVSDELQHEQQHQAVHDHGHSHDHAHPYTHRSFQSILGLLADCQLNDDVKAMTLKIYTILAVAEAEVHGETLETVHFHEVGRPHAIINMVGIAAAVIAINPAKVYCSKIMDGMGTVLCAHGKISIPVPAVRALMKTSNLQFGTKEIDMEMVTPTGLAALLALEPQYLDLEPSYVSNNHVGEIIVKTMTSNGTKKDENSSLNVGLKGFLLKDLT